MAFYICLSFSFTHFVHDSDHYISPLHHFRVYTVQCSCSKIVHAKCTSASVHLFCHSALGSRMLHAARHHFLLAKNKINESSGSVVVVEVTVVMAGAVNAKAKRQQQMHVTGVVTIYNSQRTHFRSLYFS